jgi:hypothetical protein
MNKKGEREKRERERELGFGETRYSFITSTMMMMDIIFII